MSTANAPPAHNPLPCTPLLQQGCCFASILVGPCFPNHFSHAPGLHRGYASGGSVDQSQEESLFLKKPPKRAKIRRTVLFSVYHIPNACPEQKRRGTLTKSLFSPIIVTLTMGGAVFSVWYRSRTPSRVPARPAVSSPLRA